MADLPIRCFCGAFEGVAGDMSPGAGTHVTCYCEDCQAFQHALGQGGRVLDDNGGTQIFQTSPGRIRVTKGKEHLACLRLGPNGPVRWYTSCCNTPIGNTLWTPAVPFIGIITVCFDTASDESTVSKTLGPLKRGVFGKFATGDRANINAHDAVPLSLHFGFLGRLLRWRLRKDNKLTPFFNRETGELVVEPRALTKEERERAGRGETVIEN